MSTIPLKDDGVYYPDSDGRPMAESDLHREVMIDLIHGLQDYYADASDIYVSGNLMVYDVPGDPSSYFSPDAFVVQGVPKGMRRLFKIWEEGRVPCFVIEVTSEETRQEDEAKRERYERLGVEECFLFDPYGEYLNPRLQGYRLEGGRYQPIESLPDGSLVSQVTGLTLQIEGERLRLVDNTPREKKLLWDDERSAEFERERIARKRAEEELVRLRQEIERLRRNSTKDS
jgi:Uma2 family endonuclease